MTELPRPFARIVTATLLAALVGTSAAQTEPDFLILQSTTSTRNSGLLDAILPVFTQSSGIEVRVVAVGTGQAISNAINGDGDLLMVHAKEAEIQFVEQGWGVARFDLMFNDFVLTGPPDDPASIKGESDIVTALKKIADSGEIFVSRGDDSGTHLKELKLWNATGVDVALASGSWYRETGAGMGATLNISIGMGGYTLTDRASWVSFGYQNGFVIHSQGDPRLFNQYGIIVVNPEKHARTKFRNANLLQDWLLGPVGQQEIANFRVEGQQLFTPNAK